MARIIESGNGNRRIIKMTTDDIVTIVSEYQRLVPRGTDYENTRNYLENAVLYIPEDI
jgi:hypothetical protein